MVVYLSKKKKSHQVWLRAKIQKLWDGGGIWLAMQLGSLRDTGVKLRVRGGKHWKIEEKRSKQTRSREGD